MQRIYADFNTLMSEPVDWVKVASAESAATVNAAVRDGERVMLYDEEIEVEATLRYDERYAYWLADPDWSTRRILATTAQPHASA